MLQNDEDDNEIFESDKFDDCKDCRNRFRMNICNGCGFGEDFEEEDYDEVDKHFNGRV
jgi:hypothetical protein